MVTKKTKTVRKRIKRKDTTSDTPPPTVLLALDPAITSGWAIWLNGDLHSSGVAKNSMHRRQVVDTCWDLVEDPAEIMIVFEKTTFGPKKTVWGLGRAMGKWLECAESANVPAKNVSSLSPGQWRRKVWPGKRMPGNKAQRRAGWKAWAISWVRTYHGVDAKTDDEAEAIMIGRAWLLDQSADP